MAGKCGRNMTARGQGCENARALKSIGPFRHPAIPAGCLLNEGTSQMVVPMTEPAWRRLAILVVVAGAAIRCYAAFAL